MEPDAEVDEHGFLKVALPSVTVTEGEVLELAQNILDRFDGETLSNVTVNKGL